MTDQLTERQIEQDLILRRIATLWAAHPDRTLGQMVESIAYARRRRMGIDGQISLDSGSLWSLSDESLRGELAVELDEQNLTVTEWKS